MKSSFDVDMQITGAEKELKEKLGLLNTVEIELHQLKKRFLEIGEAKRKAKLDISTHRINLDMLKAEFWRLKKEGL